MTAQMSRARRNVIVLFAAQAILGAQMPMIFVVGALAGKILSPNPCMVTLPLSMIILGTALTPARWLVSCNITAAGPGFFWRSRRAVSAR